MKYVPHKDKKEVMADLEKVHQALTLEKLNKLLKNSRIKG